MNFEKYHWRHFFGGAAFVLLLAQIGTGVFLTLYYQPHLKEAYDSVRFLYNHMPVGAIIRDSHRWLALFLMISIIIHSLRSLLRQDYLNPDGKILWLTGSLMILLLLGFLATGVILPWEWRAYWFMEMTPNLLGHLPWIGAQVKAFLIDAFTMNRAFVLHIIILPIILLIGMDYHVLNKTRKKRGGIFRYLWQHGLLTLPFFIATIVLSIDLPMPTQDPEILPDPLAGTDIPTVEWFLLVFWLPFMHFKGVMAPLLGFYLPVVVFLVLTVLPFYVKSRTQPPGPVTPTAKLAAASVVIALSVGLFGLMYAGTWRSPTLGCNACHNVALGTRMGIPPEAFKDHNIVPLLDNEEWMTLHWFFPQRVW
ncbi:MAG: cytochrome b N-terminal domain-containing protein [Magnetococcus sp. YQC-5]